MPRELFDYRDLTPDAVANGVAALLAEAENEIARAERSVHSPSLEATITPLEAARAIAAVANGRYGILAKVHPDALVRDAAQQAADRLRQFRNDVEGRRGVYEAVSAVLADADEDRDDDARAILAWWQRTLKEAGWELSDDDRDKLFGLRRRLAALESQFARNLTERAATTEVPATSLDGVDRALLGPIEPGADGDSVRLNVVTAYGPFLAASADRSAREKVFRHYWTPPDPNVALLAEAAALRAELASLLGYPNWAQLRIERAMAGSPEAIREMYDVLLPKLQRAVDREIADIERGLDSDDETRPAQPWDVDYYQAKKRSALFGADADALAEYLPLDGAWDGLLAFSSEVFGVRFQQIPDARAWHDDVRLYSVHDAVSDELIGHFYFDPYTRPGKPHDAWADVLAPADSARDLPPVVALFTYFTPPSAGRPALLRHQGQRAGDLWVLFHEFGHVLHFLFARSRYTVLLTDAIEQDFVEAPSQLFEHWAFDKAVLRRIAFHHSGGTPAPSNLVDAVTDNRWFGAATVALRMAAVSLADLSLHEGPSVDPVRAEREMYETLPFSYPEGTCSNAVRPHLMDGYDSSYYGYQWAEVVGDELFTALGESVGAVAEPGRRYREEILAPGATRPAAELVRAFLGRDPTPDSWLRYRGS